MVDLHAVIPGHLQSSAGDLAIDRQKMAAGLSRAAGASAPLPGSPDQCVVGKELVELPQIVEADLRRRQRADWLDDLRVFAEIAQQAVADAPARNAAKLLF